MRLRSQWSQRRRAAPVVIASQSVGIPQPRPPPSHPAGVQAAPAQPVTPAPAARRRTARRLPTPVAPVPEADTCRPRASRWSRLFVTTAARTPPKNRQQIPQPVRRAGYATSRRQVTNYARQRALGFTPIERAAAARFPPEQEAATACACWHNTWPTRFRRTSISKQRAAHSGRAVKLAFSSAPAGL